MGSSRAQSSLEFLYALAVMLVFFICCLMVYYLAQTDINSLSWDSESRAVCRSASAQVSSILSGGSGASSAISLPGASFSYSLRVSGPNRLMTVVSFGRSLSCPLPTSNISNGTHSEFYMSDGSIIRNADGGVVIG